MSFWLAAAALAVAAVALVLLPTRRGDPAASARTDHLRRIAEFETDLALAEIAAEDADAARAEIERSVLRDSEAAATVEATAGRARFGAWLAALSVPLVAAAIYATLGQPDLAVFDASHLDLDLADPQASVVYLLEAIEAQARAEPNDVEAQTILARTYLKLGRHDDAVTAAEAVVRLAPAASASRLLLADALSMQAGGKLTARAVGELDAVLANEPDNAMALVLRGIADEQNGEHDAAVVRWRRALSLLPAQSPLRVELQAMIGEDPPATAPPFAVTLAASADPALTTGLATDTPVFAYLRATSGGPPIAAARVTLGELPRAIVLDQPLAMGAAVTDGQVEAVLRIAVSGSPRPAAGDLEGRSAPFALSGEHALEIHADRRLGD